MASNTERTFIAVKPDGVQRGLVGEIIKRFEQKGFRLVAMKFMHRLRRRSFLPPPYDTLLEAGLL
uniref:nucleoside-diphosphate kinase n=1 Tax=Chelydra serpentina TaxID=8475 RepID=A0A8C3SPC0_CHESE